MGPDLRRGGDSLNSRSRLTDAWLRPRPASTSTGSVAMEKRIELVSPYPVEECKRRLEAQMHRSMPILSLAETRPVPVIGRIRGTRLRARRGTWYGNSFKTYLSAEFIAEG